MISIRAGLSTLSCSAGQPLAKKLALFDVDRTVMAGYSGYFATLRLIRAGLVKKRRLAEAIFYKLITPLYKVDARRLYREILSDMAGCPIESALAIGQLCFIEDLRPRLFTGAIARIRQHQADGHPTYFITAGPYMVIKVLGDFLGVHSDYAPRPQILDGRIQADVIEPLAYLDGKLAIARQIVEREGVGLEDCFFYSDNIDDRLLLEAVGHAHAVNPDRHLRRLAREKGWPILRFDRTLGEGESDENF